MHKLQYVEVNVFLTQEVTNPPYWRWRNGSSYCHRNGVFKYYCARFELLQKKTYT